MGFLRRLLDGWLDRRFSGAAREAARATETRAGGFGHARTAVFRVPLPLREPLSLRFAGEPELRVRRSLLGWLGLGERLYLVDAVPMGMLEHPLGLLVFRGLSRRPATALWGTRLPLLQGEPVPIGDDDWLRAHVVHNVQAIPPAREPGGVQLSLPPLVGPFPRRRAPIPPSGGFTAPSGTGALPTGACPPVHAFFGLCLQAPLAPPDDPKRETMTDWTSSLGSAFQGRGYPARSYTAGDAGLRTFDQMVEAFRRDLAAVPNLCRCPDDKVVIFLTAHGGQGTLQWQVDAANPETVSIEAFAQALAGTPAIAANPAKFVLLVASCYSGQLFLDELPGALAGMGLVTSTSDETVTSVRGGLAGWIQDALGDRGVRTWEDLTARVMWGWRNDKAHHTRPRTGWFEGCRATATVRSVAYAGTDMGSAWSLEYLTRTPSETVATALVHGQSTPLGTTLLDRLIRPCDGTSHDLFVQLQAQIDFGGQRRSGFQGKRVSQPCDPETRTTHDFTVGVSGDAGQVADLEVTFELHTRCVP